MKVKYSNGDIYDGEINKKGEPNGYGKKTYKDGSTYDGNWKNGLKSGSGRVIQKDGSFSCGIWERGVYVGSNAEKKQADIKNGMIKTTKKANVLYKLGAYNWAKETYEKITDLHKEIPSDILEKIERCEGSIALRSLRIDQAVEVLKALGQALIVYPVKGVIEVIKFAGRVIFSGPKSSSSGYYSSDYSSHDGKSTSNYDNKESEYDKGQREKEEDEKKANSYYDDACDYYAKDNYEEAIRCFENAKSYGYSAWHCDDMIKNCKEAERNERANADYDEAYNYYTNSNYGEAIRFFEKAKYHGYESWRCNDMIKDCEERARAEKGNYEYKAGACCEEYEEYDSAMSHYYSASSLGIDCSEDLARCERLRQEKNERGRY